jgi:NhaA family Na+:H+ antiporter
MGHDSHRANRPIRRFLFENSIFLVSGALVALIWANTHAKSYEHFVHFDLSRMFVEDEHGDDHEDSHKSSDHKEDDHKDGDHKDGDQEDGDQEDGDQEGADQDSTGDKSAANESEDKSHDKSHVKSDDDGDVHDSTSHGLTIHFLINDILMALFFALAGKEVWESFLPGGPLSSPRKAATPLLATLGGILGPTAVYLTIVAVSGETASLGRGWAIPCATDIAFSYLVAKLIFGASHPAIAFLLLLAIADDAAGLIILAIAYPRAPIEFHWLLLTVAAVGIGFTFRKMKLQSFWWYLLIPGTLCWLSFHWAHIHPALGLVPIIPCMPHAHTDLGIFARDELNRHDTLNEFEHWWKNPVEIILGVFGLVNAGVMLSSVGTGTWAVLFGLIIGKPLGITLFTYIAEKVFGLEVPKGMNYRHVVTLGMIAAIGFTVALFVSTAAFTEPKALASVKMGALLSFGAAILSFVVAKALGVKPNDHDTSTPGTESDYDS